MCERDWDGCESRLCTYPRPPSVEEEKANPTCTTNFPLFSSHSFLKPSSSYRSLTLPSRCPPTMTTIDLSSSHLIISNITNVTLGPFLFLLPAQNSTLILLVSRAQLCGRTLDGPTPHLILALGPRPTRFPSDPNAPKGRQYWQMRRS